MRHIKFLSTFIALGFVAAPQIARATVAEVHKTQGKQMSANFTSDTSCGGTGAVTSTDIQWGDLVQTDQISSPPSSTSQHFSNIFLTIRYQNPCSGDDLFMTGFIDNPHANSAVHVTQASNLSSGHLDAVIHVATESGPANQADLVVNLNWTATGPATNTSTTTNTIEGGVITNSTITSSGRPGRASGSVSGTIHLMNGQNQFVNFLTDPSFQASLSKNSITDNIVRP